MTISPTKMRPLLNELHGQRARKPECDKVRSSWWLIVGQMSPIEDFHGVNRIWSSRRPNPSLRLVSLDGTPVPSIQMGRRNDLSLRSVSLDGTPVPSRQMGRRNDLSLRFVSLDGTPVPSIQTDQRPVSRHGCRRTSGARMKRSVNFFEVFAVDVRVDLCRGDIHVTKHFLDCAKISATFQKMSGK
jgi:hypothetical protein